MNSTVLDIVVAPTFFVENVSCDVASLETLRRIDFSHQICDADADALKDALSYYAASPTKSISSVAIEMMRRGQSNHTLNRLRGVLYDNITSSGVRLPSFTALICVFTHETSIDISLKSFGIARCKPSQRGHTIYRGVCHICSEIISGLEYNEQCKSLEYTCKIIARLNETLLPTVKPGLELTNATAYTQKLFTTFGDIVSASYANAGKHPAALQFVFEVVGYLLYMANNDDAAPFANTNTALDVVILKYITRIIGALKKLRIEKTIDDTSVLAAEMKTSGHSRQTYTPNITRAGIITEDTPSGPVIIAGKSVDLELSNSKIIFGSKSCIVEEKLQSVV